MERETKTLVTPLLKTLVLKEYLTAKERNAYIAVMQEQGFDAENPDMMSAIRSAGALFDAVVINYDGKTEGLLDVLENSRSSEYDFVLKSAAEIVGGNLDEAK